MPLSSALVATRVPDAKMLLLRYATPITTGLALVSAVSGVALFFRWWPAGFHAMHEWLSMVLLAPVALHLWKNWSSLVVYAKRGRLLLPIVAMLLVAVPFAWPALTGMAGPGSPGARAVRVLTQAPLTTLAPVLGTSPEELAAGLRARGYTVGTTTETLEAIAAASHAPPAKLLTENLPAH